MVAQSLRLRLFLRIRTAISHHTTIARQIKKTNLEVVDEESDKQGRHQIGNVCRVLSEYCRVEAIKSVGLKDNVVEERDDAAFELLGAILGLHRHEREGGPEDGTANICSDEET